MTERNVITILDALAAGYEQEAKRIQRLRQAAQTMERGGFEVNWNHFDNMSARLRHIADAFEAVDGHGLPSRGTIEAMQERMNVRFKAMEQI